MVSVFCVGVGTWLIGQLPPKMMGRSLQNYELTQLPGVKHDLKRITVRWLSALAALVVGAYKIRDVTEIIIER